MNESKVSNGRFHLEHWQKIALLLACYDIVAINASYIVALWLRFDFRFSMIPLNYIEGYKKFAIAYTVFCILVFGLLKLYKSVWRFASYHELIKLIMANAITGAAYPIVTILLHNRMPISYYMMGITFQFCATLGIRFSYRFYLFYVKTRRKSIGVNVHRVMMIGGGEAGQILLRDLNQSGMTRDKVVCIIDDNPNKWGRYVEGVPIVGGRASILENCNTYNIQKIFFAIPTATIEQRKEILNICKETGCEIKVLPGLYQLADGQISVKDMRDVAIEELLGRESIQVDMTEIFSFISKKRILVTGGGGSIGSELCRQIASHKPEQLIIFDVYENNAYDIEQELRKKYPDLNLVVLIGSVRDSRRIMKVFETYRPEVVYHAAAHKHVPLMETSPNESIKNNAIGTYKTAYAAMKYGCKRFVLISTDKAVNPTNIMGASKRLCEMVIQSFDKKIKEGKENEIPLLYEHADEDDKIDSVACMQKIMEHSDTEFVAVRFGNVLGSNGSVIPLFKKQIAAGGPVTVTHPDIIRYFMTIPEAVSLVLQAGVYAQGGEIFVLDMGDPVKIDTLARNLIKLCGYKPDVDIKVVYTGLRPGEKLYEEKLMKEEGMKTTPNQLIHIGRPIDFDVDWFLEKLGDLMESSYENIDEIRAKVQEMVPTYHPYKS